MPRLSEETIGTGDQSWLASAHGIWNCRTVPLDLDEFTSATHFPDGYLPSGTPLSIVDGVAVPYADGALAGFLFTDQRVVHEDEVINVPLLVHGSINVDKLPGSFDPETVTVAHNFTWFDGGLPAPVAYPVGEGDGGDA